MVQIKRNSILFGILIGWTAWGFSQPIKLHPENPHYFEYRNKPEVLISSAMHYAAVLNLDMDYNLYLEILEAYGFNQHREFIIPCYDWKNGDEWYAEQTPLSPRPGKLISPYARSAVAGGIDNLNKYDLNTWNPLYFKRLKDFCRKAGEKGVVIEIVLFTVLYEESMWETNPLNAKNNINDIGKGHYDDYTFIREPGLFDRQKELVLKIVEELNEFDNVYYELCNEPYWAKGTPGRNPVIKSQHFLPEVNIWQAELAETIIRMEKNLPKKHLIAQNFANTYYKIDTLCHPSVSVLNFHYAFPPRAVPDNFQFNLPLSFDETADGCDAPNRRMEAWAFMLSGGAVYSNLDWSFAIDDQTGLGRNPVGRRRSGLEVKQQLSVLKHFMDNFDFIRSKPIESHRVQNMPEKVLFWGLETKSELAAYFLKRAVIKLNQATIELNVGNYELSWIDPLNGSVISKTGVTVQNNNLKLDFPEFSDDILLLIKRK